MGIVCPQFNCGLANDGSGNYIYYATDCDTQAPSPLYSQDANLPLGCCDVATAICQANSITSPLCNWLESPPKRGLPQLHRKLSLNESYPYAPKSVGIEQLDAVDCKVEVSPKKPSSAKGKKTGGAAPGQPDVYLCRLFLVKIAPSGCEPLYLRHGFELEGCHKAMRYLPKGHLIGGAAPRFNVAHGGQQYEVVLAVPKA